MDELKEVSADYGFENSTVEVKTRIAVIRDLHASFFRLARLALENKSNKIFLILIDPKISIKRVQTEWNLAKKVYAPFITKKLFLVVFSSGEVIFQSLGIQNEYIKNFEQAFVVEVNSKRKSLRQIDFKAEILKILLNVWILNLDEPLNLVSENNLQFVFNGNCSKQKLLTITELETMVGCTYRTVDRAFDFIGAAIERKGNKGFRLKYFPRSAWEKMVVLSSKSRNTMKFVNRSNTLRSPDSLIKRLKRLDRPDIAIGGVAGAFQIFPGLDITGTPRLDLTVHSPDETVDMSFLRYLDPALKPWQKDDPPPSLSVHFLRRKSSFFRIDKAGLFWADPIECLLDLLEAKLDYQALEFRRAILPDGVN